MNNLERMAKAAKAEAEKLSQQFRRDSDNCKIYYSEFDLENLDHESMERKEELVLAHRYSEELEAICQGKHENHLNILAYEARVGDMESYREVSSYFERVGNPCDRWGVGAIFREEEYDQSGIDSKYSVLRKFLPEEEIVDILKGRSTPDVGSSSVIEMSDDEMLNWVSDMGVAYHE